MITRLTSTSLLVAASLALSSPALAQTARCADLSRLTDLAPLADLSHLQELRQLDRLPGRLAISPDQMLRLDELARLTELPQIRDLERLAARLPHDPARQVARHARQAGPEQTEKFSKTFRVGPNASLDLSNVSGDIVIKGGPGEDIVIDATKRTPEGPEASKNLQAVTIDAVESAGRVEVRTRYPERGRNIRTSVDFSVTVPGGAAVYVHTIAGDIALAGVHGAVRLNTVSGDVRVDGAGQIEEVKAISGDITITGGAAVDLRASTVNGELVLRNVKARSVEASTISGDLRLTDVTAERAAARTMSGGVDYTGPFARGGRYEFKTHSGDVRVSVAAGTGFEVNAESFSGEIRSDLPATAKAGELSGRHPRRELRGTVGDGSALLTVSTFSGDITIGKR